MEMFKLAFKSLVNRRVTVLLTILSIAISVTLLLGVERVRTQAKDSFANTISDTDVIVGARTGSVQLLLYSIFRIGNATNNISWESYEDIANHKSVKWTVPISLGDSHRGFRVLGTTGDYFDYYRFGKKQPLMLAEGERFDGLFDAVIGAEVAKKLGYHIGDSIVIAHGAGAVSFVQHDQHPFTVVGILAPTSTPVDRTVHVSLQAIEAIHAGWGNGQKVDPEQFKSQQFDLASLNPEVITAALVGVNSKIRLFQLQRYINQYSQEPLMAILPGVALRELWNMMGIAEQALVVISAFVVVAGLLGMLTMILSSLNERRREMAILRAVGARPMHIFMLMISEATILAIAGAVLGVGLMYIGLLIAQPIMQSQFGISLTISMLSVYEWKLVSLVCVAGLATGIVPSIRAYRLSLVDGMTIRV